MGFPTSWDGLRAWQCPTAGRGKRALYTSGNLWGINLGSWPGLVTTMVGADGESVFPEPTGLQRLHGKERVTLPSQPRLQPQLRPDLLQSRNTKFQVTNL